jgi:hypothetical protein
MSNLLHMNAKEMASMLGLRPATERKSASLRNARLAKARANANAAAARKFNNALEAALIGQRNAWLRVLAAINKERAHLRTSPQGRGRTNALAAQRNAYANVMAKVNEQIKLLSQRSAHAARSPKSPSRRA